MTAQPKSELAAASVRHPEEVSTVCSRTETPTNSSATLVRDSIQPKEPVFTKPFDLWRPLGGGAHRDIFRYFKICPAEEQAFLVFYASKRLTNGFVSHDEGGILVFRVSSAHLSELAGLGISCTNTSTQDYEWFQVCDGEGISWLTQAGCTDMEKLPSELHTTAGQPVSENGRIGRYGPSGLTVREYWMKQQSQS
jgi:hypothetical protein